MEYQYTIVLGTPSMLATTNIFATMVMLANMLANNEHVWVPMGSARGGDAVAKTLDDEQVGEHIRCRQHARCRQHVRIYLQVFIFLVY